MVRHRAYSNEQLALLPCHRKYIFYVLWKDKNSTFVLSKREFQLLLVNSVDYSETIFSCLVGGGSYHAASVGGATHDDGLAAIFWVVPLLDAGVEGVQIEMEDRSCFFVHHLHGLSAVSIPLPLYQHLH